MKYLASAFSPSMLAKGTTAFVVEIAPGDIPEDAISVVGHEVTAKIISAILGRPVEFNRSNITLRKDDILYCVIPQFRDTSSREFTREEVLAAGFRAFKVVAMD